MRPSDSEPWVPKLVMGKIGTGSSRVSAMDAAIFWFVKTPLTWAMRIWAYTPNSSIPLKRQLSFLGNGSGVSMSC